MIRCALRQFRVNANGGCLAQIGQMISTAITELWPAENRERMGQAEDMDTGNQVAKRRRT